MTAYRMTPRRRAALRKAQLVSANKRRGRRRKIIAAVGGVTVLTAAAAAGAFVGHRYVQGLKGGPVRPTVSPSKELVHVPGHGRTYTITHIRRRAKYPHQPRRTTKHLFKVDAKGTVTSTTKRRMIYDSSRRRQYWRSKPVARGK